VILIIQTIKTSDELMGRLDMKPEDVVQECKDFGLKHNISDAKEWLQ
jgi:hypothetical protein